MSATAEVEWRLPNLAELQSAAKLVARHVPVTPQYRWPLLCHETNCELWIKHENHAPTGSFKIRGGIVYLEWLRSTQPDVRGVVTATRGNHGQSIAFSAKQVGIRTVVVVPRGNSKEKNGAMRALGAELIEHGESFHDADAHADELASVRRLHKIPSFHPMLIRGVGSYALELFSAVADLDAVYVPMGWGSGASGLAAARNALGVRTAIIGVVSKQAPSYARSIEAAEVIDVPSKTRIADGIAISHPLPAAFDLVRREVERVVEVDDDAVEHAMRLFFRATHNVAEGAGAAALAAVLQERTFLPGKRIAAILTGGNVDADVYGRVLAAQR
jgi:threonine dehydratase